MHTQAKRMVLYGGEGYKIYRQGTAMDKGTGRADRGSFVHSFAGNVEGLGGHPARGDNVKQSDMRRVSLSVAMVGSSLYFQEVCQ